MTVCHYQMHVERGVVHVGILHIGEELLVEFVVKLVSTCAERFEWQLEC